MKLTLLIYDLSIPASHSLKEKRKALRSIKDGLRHNFNVSVAEVDYSDIWQNAKIAISYVCGNGRLADSAACKIDDFFDKQYSVIVTKMERIDY